MYMPISNCNPLKLIMPNIIFIDKIKHQYDQNKTSTLSSMRLLHIETSTERTQNKEKLKLHRKRNCQKSRSTRNEKEQIHQVIEKGKKIQ